MESPKEYWNWMESEWEFQNYWEFQIDWAVGNEWAFLSESEWEYPYQIPYWKEFQSYCLWESE